MPMAQFHEKLGDRGDKPSKVTSDGGTKSAPSHWDENWGGKTKGNIKHIKPKGK